jgi:hypothetical protein
MLRSCMSTTNQLGARVDLQLEIFSISDIILVGRHLLTSTHRHAALVECNQLHLWMAVLQDKQLVKTNALLRGLQGSLGTQGSQIY